MKKVLAMSITAIMIFSLNLLAAGPSLMNYQGRLTDSAGDPVVDGSYSIDFVIYDASTGGTIRWSETQSVTTVDGLYAVLLGSVNPIAGSVFNGPNRWLAVAVNGDPEMVPRTRIVSNAYSLRSNYSDSTEAAELAHSVAPGSIGSVAINDTEVQARVTGTAGAGEYITAINSDGTVVTGVDQGGTGDITAVNAGSGLTGGGTSGDVTLSIPANGINSSHLVNSSVGTGEIINNTITDSDISSSANIQATKISGTAATLNANQTFSGDNTYTNDLFIGDSTFHGNNTGVIIGSPDSPNSSNLLLVQRGLATTSTRIGVNSFLENSSSGHLYGIRSTVRHSTASTGSIIYGFDGFVQSDASNRVGLKLDVATETAHLTSGSPIGANIEVQDGLVVKGVYCYAADGLNDTYGLHGYSVSDNGNVFGVRGYATGVSSIKYAVYGSTGGSGTNWAGYFQGNCNVTGVLSKGGGAFRIDHPLDPENKFLQHSFVESPDMMNIYNGNIVTDGSGYATVTMPDWFDALNRNFRYQLTVIGEFAQAIVAEKINGNSFVIRTDKPAVEVSWQVTGVRHDAFAEANRIQIEVDKKVDEQGKYAHPAAFGKSPEEGIDWKNHQEPHQADNNQ